MKKLSIGMVLVLFFIFSPVAYAFTPVDDSSNGASEEDLYEIVNTMMGTTFTDSTQLYPYEVECDDWWHEWNGFIAITVTYAGQDQNLYWEDGTNWQFILSRSADLYNYTQENFNVNTPTADFYWRDSTNSKNWYSRDDLNSDGETHFITYDMSDFAPNQEETFIVAVEDLPNLGDGDYNDFVFKARKAGPQCLCIDNDTDGYGNPGHPVCPNGSQLDCDDNDDTVNPGATEVPYNGKDDDCNPLTKDDDIDGDGYPDATDCDDNDAAVHPGASEICNDGKDNECDGLIDCSDSDCTAVPPCCTDNDGDTYAVEGGACGAVDCNDGNAAVSPGATEICNGVDDNCNGQTDEGCVTYYQDSDSDGYGNAAVSQVATSPPAGYVTNSSDCDDTNGSINPGATEICNGVDDNCNGQTDEGCVTYYQDSDSDGYGNAAVSQVATSPPAGYVPDSTDCDDTNGSINPGATEICNGVDDDCDTQIDEGCSLYYLDGDSDGYGNPAGPTTTVPQSGYVANAGDCDDTNGSINPGATEICNGVDDNCNGQTDEGCVTYYQDSDSDGYGNAAVSQVATSPPAGYVTDSSDCDDTNGSINPGATEICNGVDDDCNGQTDEGCVTYYQDSDSDSYGNAAVSQVATSPPAGYVPDSTDCDDTNGSINPSATEICNGVDDDCDGQIDEGCSTCTDNDNDTYAVEGGACGPVDCNDTDSAVNPGATEVPYNGKDDDCDASTLDDDLDDDGYPIATDCNDNDNSVYPGATEICNDFEDNDCDGDLNCDDSDCSGNPQCDPSNCTDNDGDGFFLQGGLCGPADCNDGDNSVYPGAGEVCDDGQDNDCDGDTDCADIDCAGDTACFPTAVAMAKTISVGIPGYKCFRVQIDNPGPLDVDLSQTISWLPTPPSDVQTTLLPGPITVPARQSRTIFYPCFNVGAGSAPGSYDCDINWIGTDSLSNPIQITTDPTLSLFYYSGSGGSTGGVGGIGLPVNKLALLTSILGPFVLMAGILLSIILWRKKRASARKADG